MKQLIIFKKVATFIDKLPNGDSSKLLAHLSFLESGKTEMLSIKTLRKKIKEIIVAQYRIVYFIIDDIIYVVDAFRKKTQKTPLPVIEQADKLYKELSAE